MKVKFGMIVVDGSGKLGGQVMSKNRGGKYIRTKVTPTNPNTAAQAAVRNRLTSFAQGFRALTAAQIDGWNAAVSDFQKTDIFGDIKKPSGINLYVKLNSNLGEVSIAAIANAPLPSAVEQIVSTILTADSAPQTLGIVTDPILAPANTSVIVRATAQMSPAKQPSKSDFRNILVIPAAGSTTADILAAYTAKFGALVAGRKIAVELLAVNETTGQKGIAVSDSAIVA